MNISPQGKELGAAALQVVAASLTYQWTQVSPAHSAPTLVSRTAMRISQGLPGVSPSRHPNLSRRPTCGHWAGGHSGGHNQAHPQVRQRWCLPHSSSQKIGCCCVGYDARSRSHQACPCMGAARPSPWPCRPPRRRCLEGLLWGGEAPRRRLRLLLHLARGAETRSRHSLTIRAARSGLQRNENLTTMTCHPAL